MAAMMQCYECKKFYKGRKSIQEHGKRTGHKIEAPEGVSLEDSTKFKAEIATLNDSLKSKTVEIASLQDSIKTRDAEFTEVAAELAQLNDKVNSSEYKLALLHDFIHSPDLSQASYEKMHLGIQQLGEERGFIPKPQPATVEDSKTTGEAPPTVATTAAETKKPAAVVPLADNNPEEKPESEIFMGKREGNGWRYFPALHFSAKVDPE
jgi:hypothetical protein